MSWTTVTGKVFDFFKRDPVYTDPAPQPGEPLDDFKAYVLNYTVRPTMPVFSLTGTVVSTFTTNVTVNCEVVAAYGTFTYDVP